MIRPLEKDELPRCIEHGKAFHAEFQLAGEFIPEVFLRNWNTFYDRQIGTVLSLWHDDQLIGGLGGFLAPDLFDDRLCATEIFWFVSKPFRTGSGAIRLLDAYERWSFISGAVECRLLYLNGEDGAQDERFHRLYRSRGYYMRETGWIKPLVNLSELVWPL